MDSAASDSQWLIFLVCEPYAALDVSPYDVDANIADWRRLWTAHEADDSDAYYVAAALDA